MAAQLFWRCTRALSFSRRIMDPAMTQTDACTISSQSRILKMPTKDSEHIWVCFVRSRTMAGELSIPSQKYIPRAWALYTKNWWMTSPEVSPRNRACCFSEVKRIPSLFSRHRILNRLVKKESVTSAIRKPEMRTISCSDPPVLHQKAGTVQRPREITHGAEVGYLGI
jgi:hypothetical protein